MKTARAIAANDNRLPPMRRIWAALAVMVVCGCLIALGVWQLQRRDWKLALIRQVEQRADAIPVPAPAPDAWSAEVAAQAAYRRVRLHGRFEDRRATFVQAVTTYGSGYWLMVPFRDDRGFAVLVNRGFVPAAFRTAPRICRGRPAKPVGVVGLLRLSEPGGAVVRRNDPAADRWYTRDVAGIARARGIDVAPYFVDADRSASAEPPIGGLTVRRFANNHLAYALTWFGLAATLAILWFTMVRRTPG